MRGIKQIRSVDCSKNRGVLKGTESFKKGVQINKTRFNGAVKPGEGLNVSIGLINLENYL